MLYDSYHKKISKIVDVLRKIFKHIVLISIVLGLLLAFLLTFMITKGIVLDDLNISDNFKMSYGDELPMKAGAMFASPTYQYSEDGVTWSDTVPTKPGQYNVRAVAKGIFGNDRYGKVYTFTLEPRKIDVSVADSEIVYGDLPSLEASLVYGDTISCDKFIYSNRFSSVTLIMPDEENIKILNTDGEDITSSYDISVKNSLITVLQRKILVTVSDQSMIYNDMKFSYNGYELSEGTLAEGDVIQAVFDKYLIDVGEVENTPQLKVVTSDGFDITMHYEIESKVGKLKVEPRPLIIQTPSAEKLYDAIELSNTNYEIVGEYGLVEGHTMTCISNTAITDVNEVDNILGFKIFNATNEEKTNNYHLFYERGTLKIIERPLNVTFSSESWMYDNTWHAGQIILDGLVNGHISTYKIPTIIDSGIIDNITQITDIVDAQGKDVLMNYNITYGEPGKLEVTKRPITIKTESQTLTYDGISRIFDNYEIISDIKLAQDEELYLTFNEFYKAGIYDNIIASAMISYSRSSDPYNSAYNDGWYNISSGGVIDASQNYQITELIGEIVINKCPITLSPKFISKDYDGTPLVPNEYEISGTLPAGHIISTDYIGSLVDAGTIETQIDLSKTFITFVREDGSEEDATDNFDITLAKGQLTVNKRKLTVKTADAEKVYDGTPLTKNEWSLDLDTSLVSGHTLYVDCIGSRVEAGESDNVVDFNSVRLLDANGKSVIRNYDISYIYGKLIVHKRPITVVASSASKTYDGTPLTSSAYSVASKDLTDYGLLIGHTLIATTEGSITNAGEIDNYIDINSVMIFDADNNDATPNYDISVEYGRLIVKPIIVNIMTSSISKIYDAEPIDIVLNTIIDSDIGDKILYGHTYNITLPNKYIVNVNDSPVDNEAELTVYDEYGNDMMALGNYKVVGEWGVIQILPRVVRILPKPEITSKVYDGRPLYCYDYEDISDYANNEGLVGYHNIEAISFTYQIDATDSPVLIEMVGVYVNNGYGDDVTSNYKFEISPVSYEISRLPISITSASDKKIFDGKWLTNDDFTVDGNMPDGQYLSFDITGKQLEEGTSSNTIENLYVYDSDYEDVTKNYDISIIEGTLEVYKKVVAKITVTKDGYIYLKQKAYGNYSGSGFYDASTSDYYLNRNGYYHNYTLWMSLNLEKNDFQTETLTVTDAKTYMLPYYYMIGGDYDYPSYSSEEYLSTRTSYTVPYYSYNFEAIGTDPIKYRIIQSNYENYQIWVNNEYTYITSSLRRTLLEAVSDQNFENMDTETAIKAVAKYMRMFGSYKLDYDSALDKSNDIAVDFLINYKEGVCRHYAITATMLYRALGIPARYVEGYIVDAKANQVTDVKDGHAWVEVFLDGYGWVQIEVTPNGPQQDFIDITVKTKDKTVEYDGEFHYAPEELVVVDPSDVVRELIEAGYRIEATKTEGSLNLPGWINTTVLPKNVRIYDENGNDVTYKFNIHVEDDEENQGVLKVTPILIDIYFYPYAKYYDGTPINYQFPDYSLIDPEIREKVAAGEIFISIRLNISNVDVCTITSNQILNYVTYTITDKEGNQIYALNVKNKYANNDYNVIEILPREIEITAVSEERHYNEGDVLSNHEYMITIGSLVQGHTEKVEILSELDRVGTIENEISDCIIYDSNGVDVTNNYKITFVSGELTFLTDNKL